MDVREKLVEAAEVLNHYRNRHYNESSATEEYKLAQAINDVLPTLAQVITHGVTVQEWIPVKDERKPKHGDIALCYMTFEEFKILQGDDRSKVWVGDYMDYNFESVAYWQMPQPPKEE